MLPGAQAAAGMETVLVVSRELKSARCFSSRSMAVVMSSSATQLWLLSSLVLEKVPSEGS